VRLVGVSLIAFTSWPGVLTILSPLLMTLLAKGHRQAAAREGHGVPPARLRRLRPSYEWLRAAAAEEDLTRTHRTRHETVHADRALEALKGP
jgi:hypothetical protein